MEAQTLSNSSTSTCFINKKLVQQYKLALVEKSTLVLIEVIDGHSLSLGPIAHETKALNVTIGFHINKIVFNVISFIRNIVIIGFFGLLYIIYKWINIQRVFTLKHQSMRSWNLKPLLEECMAKIKMGITRRKTVVFNYGFD
jgi:hypothetical protein